MPQENRATGGRCPSTVRDEGLSRRAGHQGRRLPPATGEGGAMDHAATIRRMYDLLSAGDIDGFGDLIADDFVEHEETPGLEPTKEGVKQFFHMYRAAFPDLRMEPQDVLASGDKV